MKTKEEFFEEISNELDFNIEDYLDVNDIENYDDLYDELQDKGAFNEDIIYYGKAIDYLKEKFAGFYFKIDEFLTSYEDEKHCYCGHEIEQEAEFCSKECAKHYFSEIT